MQQRAAKYYHDPGPGGLGPVLLVLVISAALIWVGSLVWIDNSMAIIPDNEPATFVNPQSISGFAPRRTTVAYKDFGHLKVMPAESGNSDIFTSVFIHQKGYPCIMGGLSYC